MPEYRRAYIPGATYFFTVATHRRQPLLTDQRCRESLRNAINRVRSGMPFEIAAWVLLPDHLHAVWQLPPDDKDFSLRWSLIKQHVTRDCAMWLPNKTFHLCVRDAAKAACGNGASGSISFAMNWISRGIWITSITIR